MSVHDYKLPAPKTVSPLIRTARWGLLACGIFYGGVRLNYLTKRENIIHTKNQIIADKRVKEYKQERDEKSEKDMQRLAVDAGIRPKTEEV